MIKLLRLFFLFSITYSLILYIYLFFHIILGGIPTILFPLFCSDLFSFLLKLLNLFLRKAFHKDYSPALIASWFRWFSLIWILFSQLNIKFKIMDMNRRRLKKKKKRDGRHRNNQQVI